MSKAIVTFEDAGDEIKVDINFGEEGGQETSPAHQMAAMTMQVAMRYAARDEDAGRGEVG